MKNTKSMLAGLLFAGLGAATAGAAEVRTWTDVEGRQVSASFVRIEGDSIVLQTADGVQHRFPLARLSAEDQAQAKTAQSAAPAIPALSAGASVSEAARVIDMHVFNGLKKANVDRAEAKKAPLNGFNPLSSDDTFVRRVYLDIAGRIPNYEEASSFIKDGNKNKRAKLIDMLLESEGYKTHLFNYFAEMLRIKDEFEQDNVRGTPYINWFKDQINANKSWDKIVYEMVTATGKMWDKKPDGTYNGAAGYLLRDSGMPLDNLANTLTVFLGTDVACAQCHDHPFADWTQKQFYEMASFFGATTTRLNGRDLANGDPMARLMPQIEQMIEKSGEDIRRYRNGVQNFIRANQAAVKDRPKNTLKLPHDYKYKDGSPGDPVEPKFVTWTSKDKENPAYSQDMSLEKLRASFGSWMTHPENPRFAMTIANRLWKRAFGAGVNEPVTNIDDPESSTNPELLNHLAAEMKRVNFNLKEFQRIIYNTRAYQSDATTENVAMGEAYYFQGPMLRRMSAEQAWDSYMTLVLGNPDAYKAPLQDLYSRTIDMNLDTVDAQTVLVKYSAYRNMQRKENELMGGNLDMAGGDMMMEGGMSGGSSSGKKEESSSAMGEAGKFLTYEGLRLMRASEIQQPAPNGHFLIDFGQSPRNLIDGGSRIGNVPQVLMMMNGKAQKMLTNPDSLVFRTMNKVNGQPEKVERMFMTILNRRPTLREKDIAKRELSSYGEDGYANMIWALINTREFMFIQ